MSIKKFFIIGIIIGLLIPFISRAQVKITEIMYDPEGSDTKREWIEVFNAGSSDVDLSTYFFFENNIYHKLVAQSGALLESGAYAILVDSVAEVVAEYTDFMGKLFDSTFSLNNTGETVSIANSSKQILDTFTYSSDMGASNDGNSIQINDGEVIIANPTFGTLNKTESETPEVDDDVATSTDTQTDSESSDISTHTQQEGVSKYTPTTFKIGAGRDRIVSLNTPLEFEAFLSKADISPKYTWNFGDFTTGNRRRISHIYRYEGVYEVILEGRTKDYTGISRTEVQVIRPDLQITRSTTTLAVHNKSKQEVNIGEFAFNFEDGGFRHIPRNTIIEGEKTIYMPLESGVVLQDFAYPNGEIYQRFDTI
jgi:hypothetical protein